MAKVNQAISLPVLLEKVSSTFTTVIKLMVSNLMRAYGAADLIMGRAYSGGYYQASILKLTTILDAKMGPIALLDDYFKRIQSVTSLSYL